MGSVGIVFLYSLLGTSKFKVLLEVGRLLDCRGAASNFKCRTLGNSRFHYLSTRGRHDYSDHFSDRKQCYFAFPFYFMFMVIVIVNVM